MTAQVKHFGLRIAAVIFVVSVLVFGSLGITGVAARASIPGDALYPVKTSVEQARLKLAQDAGTRAQLKMSFAQERLNEIERLIAEGRFREVNPAVLAFEANINGALVELETLSKADPARASRLALEITATLTRYAQTLSTLLAGVPESVKSEVFRALDTTNIVGGIDLSFDDDNSNDQDDDSNSNGNGDDDSNSNDDNSNQNANSNDNGDDSSNSNDDRDGNSNGNDNNSNDDDDDSNANGNGDDNSNGSDDDSNSNDDDSNSNDNDDDDSNDTDDNSNDSDDNEDDSNTNEDGDDGSNDNEDDSNSNEDDD